MYFLFKYLTATSEYNHVIRKDTTKHPLADLTYMKIYPITYQFIP